MSYLSVISLADAKTYLKVQDTSSDTEITRMIKGALGYIEKCTNVLFYDRSKIYNVDSNFIRVYDYPINSVTNPASADYTATEKGTYTLYELSEETIALKVGYASVDDIPQDLLEVAYEILDIWFYAPESGKSIKDLSELSKMTLEQHKRFII